MSAGTPATRSGLLLLLLTGGVLSACGAAPGTVISGHELRLREDEFRILPYRVSVPPGRLKIVVVNAGVLAHNLVIEHGGSIVASVPTVLPGATSAPIKRTLLPGVYTLASSLSNQTNLGMTAQLTVRAR